MFNAIRGAASRWSLGGAIWGVGNTLGQGAARKYAGMAAYHGSRALNTVGRMSNAGLTSAIGGLGGGMYGAFSDDTSVLGGALSGMAKAHAIRGGFMAANLYRGTAALGMGAGQSASAIGQILGRRSSRYIGRTANEGFHRIKGLFQ